MLSQKSIALLCYVKILSYPLIVLVIASVIKNSSLTKQALPMRYGVCIKLSS